MIARLTIAAAVGALISVPASSASKLHKVSWGKAGVSFTQYNRNAQVCAARTTGVTLHLSPRTTRALDIIGNGSLLGLAAYRGLVPPEIALSPDYVHFYSTTYVETYKHATRVDIAEQLQTILDQCLAERGYQRFRLTHAQRDRLDALDPGSAARAHYLHALGSDPGVLASQSM